MNVDDENYREILQLTEEFVEAVRNLDKETASRLVSDEMKLDYRSIKGGIQGFDKNNLDKIPILAESSDASPQIHISRNEAQVIYERGTYGKFRGSDCRRQFIRQTYLYKKVENSWKLYNLKTEWRKFSGYQIKQSLSNLIEHLIGKVVGKWILKA